MFKNESIKRKQKCRENEQEKNEKFNLKAIYLIIYLQIPQKE